MKYLKGKVLVSAPRLNDPNFVRTVVLLVRHDEEGALGLVLNRPLTLTVRDACEGISEEAAAGESLLYQGGPCDGPLMVVHTREDLSESEIIPGVYFAASRHNIEPLLNADESTLRFFAGYSGWAVGQLEHELEEGAWLIGDADQSAIFATEDRWRTMNHRLELRGWVKPNLMPDDPSMN